MPGGKKQNIQRKEILGMLILKDENSFDPEAFRNDLKNNYGKNIIEPSGSGSSFACKIDDELIVAGHMPIQIPHGDIEETAKCAYNWGTVIEDLKNHKSHLIVLITNGGQDQIKRFKIFTQVICSLLRTTNALGIYKGNQSLLIPKDAYLNIAQQMTDEYLPLNLWIYFGYQVTKNGNSSYTYGLKEFGKNEMEIIDSPKSIDEISKFLYNMTHYVLGYDVIFKHGETCGMSADDKIPISLSKGKFVKGNSFKLGY